MLKNGKSLKLGCPYDMNLISIMLQTNLDLTKSIISSKILQAGGQLYSALLDNFNIRILIYFYKGCKPKVSMAFKISIKIVN